MRNNNNPLSATHTELPRFKRSNFSRGNPVRYSLPIGLFTPIEHYDITANSRVKLSISTKLDSFPAVSPLYGSVKLRYDVFFAPYRIFLPELFNNNVTETNQIDAIKFPVIRYNNNRDITQFHLGTYFELNTIENDDSVSEPIPDFTAQKRTTSLFGRVVPNGSLLEYLNYPTMVSIFGVPYASTGNTQLHQTVIAYNYDVSEENLEYLPNPTQFSLISDGFNKFNAFPFLAYVDAFCHYVANPQDDNIPIQLYGNGFDTLSNYGNYNDEAQIYRFPVSGKLSLKKLQNLVPSIRRSTGFDPLNENISWEDNRAVLDTFHPLVDDWNPFAVNLHVFSGFNYSQPEMWRPQHFFDIFKNYGTSISHVGLLPCTYLPDYFNSGIDVERYAQSTVNLTGSSISINSLRLKEREWDMKVRNMFSSYRYTDWNYLQFSAEQKLDDYTIALGGDTITFNFQDILSQTNVEGNGITDYVGGTAGKAQFDTQYFDKDSQFKTINFTARENGILLICARLVPEVDYYKGIPKFLIKTQMSDLYKPVNDAVGFDDIFSQELDASISFSQYNKSIWKVPYGWEYMKSYNKVHGLFRLPAFDSWTLNRKDTVIQNVNSNYFDSNLSVTNIINPTTYIDGTQFEDIFATISNDGDNFGIQTKIDLEVYQPMSKSVFNFD